jgi:hypothetical protein
MVVGREVRKRKMEEGMDNNGSNKSSGEDGGTKTNSEKSSGRCFIERKVIGESCREKSTS